jgi:hypothetical protein
MAEGLWGNGGEGGGDWVRECGVVLVRCAAVKMGLDGNVCSCGHPRAGCSLLHLHAPPPPHPIHGLCPTHPPPPSPRQLPPPPRSPPLPQAALAERLTHPHQLLARARAIADASAEALLDCGMDEGEAFEYLRGSVGAILGWMAAYLCQDPAPQVRGQGGEGEGRNEGGMGRRGKERGWNGAEREGTREDWGGQGFICAHVCEKGGMGERRWAQHVCR